MTRLNEYNTCISPQNIRNGSEFLKMCLDCQSLFYDAELVGEVLP